MLIKAEAAPIGGRPVLIASSMDGGRIAPGGEVDGIEVVLVVKDTQWWADNEGETLVESSKDKGGPVRRCTGDRVADGVDIIVSVSVAAVKDKERAGDNTGDNDSAKECAEEGDIEDDADALPFGISP